MKGVFGLIRSVLTGAVLAVGAILATSSNAAAVDNCNSEQWAIAQCGFDYDCYYSLYDPGPPEVCGEGDADTCWVVGETVFYEGWCFPSESCPLPSPC